MFLLYVALLSSVKVNTVLYYETFAIKVHLEKKGFRYFSFMGNVKVTPGKEEGYLIGI